MTATIVHAWLQKHPTPSRGDGGFHWHPTDGDRDLRARTVERMRGVEPPGVLWAAEPGRVAWAQLFATTSPQDGRRYSGLVLTTIVDPGVDPAELFDRLTPPAAAPWGSPERAESRIAQIAAIAPIARGLLSGGLAAVADPTDRRLPQTVASIDRMLPAADRMTGREGTWRAGAAAPLDSIATLIANAWRAPSSGAASAWRLFRELAEARGETCDKLATRLASEASSILTAEECAALPASIDTISLIHAWGRGRLDRSATATTLGARLADLVALRATSRAISGHDPNATIGEVRWHALLPTTRRTELLTALGGRTPSLRALVEDHHA